MAGLDGKHVFISYVHENNDQVDRLCKVLEAAQIPYWRDRRSLAPGDAWKAKIREAIQDGSLVFLACFSDESRTRAKSHMNEELTIAVEEFRKMPPGRTWLIPVRFDDGELPPWDLGAGRSLGDLNQVDMFGDEYAANAAALVTTTHRLMGDKQLGPASALAAVEQATPHDRADLLTRLTKEMLPDSGRRIELDDLIAQEVQRVVTVLNDPERVDGKHVSVRPMSRSLPSSLLLRTSGRSPNRSVRRCVWRPGGAPRNRSTRGGTACSRSRRRPAPCVAATLP